jgi:cell shape-determining protein MreC
MIGLDIAILISFASFIAVLLFNVYEFTKISKKMGEGFSELSSTLDGISATLGGVSATLKSVSENIQRNTKILERIEERLSKGER